jgi:hypothetical protein
VTTYEELERRIRLLPEVCPEDRRQYTEDLRRDMDELSRQGDSVYGGVVCYCMDQKDPTVLEGHSRTDVRCAYCRTHTRNVQELKYPGKCPACGAPFKESG